MCNLLDMEDIYFLYEKCSGESLKVQNKLHDFRLSQMKDWHREAIAVISDWPRLFHDANRSSGTAKYRAVCLRVKSRFEIHGARMKIHRLYQLCDWLFWLKGWT